MSDNHIGARMGAILAQHDAPGPEYAFADCTSCGQRSQRVEGSARMTDAQVMAVLAEQGWAFSPTRCPQHAGTQS